MNFLKRRYRGSERPHHLKLNKDVANWLGIVCGAVALLYVISVAVSQQVNAGSILIALGIWLIPSWACRLHEKWSTPDNDLAENRKLDFGTAYWLPYGKVVKHRSKYSHSLLGTIVRFIYGYWPALFVLWRLPLYWCVAIAGLWFLGCVVSDFAHYSLDGFNPVQWVVGDAKRNRV